jgi:hypothetical protein
MACATKKEESPMNKTIDTANPTLSPYPTLFKVVDPHSNESILFEKAEHAQDWLASHSDWILKKREIVSWTFPLEQTIAEECWVRVG